MGMIRQTGESGTRCTEIDSSTPLTSIARNSAYHDGIRANENLKGRDYLENCNLATESRHYLRKSVNARR